MCYCGAETHSVALELLVRYEIHEVGDFKIALFTLIWVSWDAEPCCVGQTMPSVKRQHSCRPRSTIRPLVVKNYLIQEPQGFLIYLFIPNANLLLIHFPKPTDWKVSGKRRRGWKCVEAGSWKAFWQKSLRRGGGGVWTTICADVSTVIILNSACYRQLPPVSHPDSWANTCQLLCHYHLYISLPPHLPLIKLVSSRLTGGLPIRPVPSLSIVRQSPSRFWRGKSRPEC